MTWKKCSHLEKLSVHFLRRLEILLARALGLDKGSTGCFQLLCTSNLELIVDGADRSLAVKVGDGGQLQLLLVKLGNAGLRERGVTKAKRLSPLPGKTLCKLWQKNVED